jgi:hypothetical protein
MTDTLDGGRVFDALLADHPGAFSAGRYLRIMVETCEAQATEWDLAAARCGDAGAADCRERAAVWAGKASGYRDAQRILAIAADHLWPTTDPAPTIADALRRGQVDG